MASVQNGLGNLPRHCRAKTMQGQDNARRSGAAEDDAGAARRDERVARALDLVDRGAAQLTGGLGREVEAVDVALADEAAVGVARETAVEREIAVGDEVLGFAEPAEAEALELHEEDGRERVVDQADVDVVACDAEVTEEVLGE